MREEPVVFINGQACAPRTEGNMNENVEYLTQVRSRIRLLVHVANPYPNPNPDPNPNLNLTQIEGYELDAMER